MKKSSRRLRMHYSVSYGADNSHWWCPRLKKWVDFNDPQAKDLAMWSCRNFDTKTKAFAHADTLPSGTTIARFDPHCGRRTPDGGTWNVTEWVVTKP